MLGEPGVSNAELVGKASELGDLIVDPRESSVAGPSRWSISPISSIGFQFDRALRAGAGAQRARSGRATRPQRVQERMAVVVMTKFPNRHATQTCAERTRP